MCQNANRPERNVCIWEGWARWISERNTTEEKLVAYETIMAIAFPEDDSVPYRPPQKPTDGSVLSRCDLIRRDVYNQWHGIIENRAGRNGMKMKNPIRVEVGRMGAAKRWGKKLDSDSSSYIDDNNNLILSGDSIPKQRVESSSQYEELKEETKGLKDINSVVSKPLSIIEQQALAMKRTVANAPIDEELEALEPYHKPNRYSKIHTPEDKEQIAFWKEKFPDYKALQAWIEKNWTLQNKQVAVSEDFCIYAFNILDEESNWCSSKDHKPFRGIQNVLHWLVIRYKQQKSSIEAAEKRIEREQREADFETKVSMSSQKAPEELAALERRKRKAAEREAMEKIRRGEILGDA